MLNHINGGLNQILILNARFSFFLISIFAFKLTMFTFPIIGTRNAVSVLNAIIVGQVGSPEYFTSLGLVVTIQFTLTQMLRTKHSLLSFLQFIIPYTNPYNQYDKP